MDWNQTAAALISAGAVVVLMLLLGLGLRRWLLARLARLAQATSSHLDDVIVASLARALPIWLLLGGLFIAARILQLPPALAAIATKLLVSALIVAITVWAANLGTEFLKGPGGATSAAPATGVVRYAVRIVAFTVGGLVLLSNLGISITPVLTTLGIGGLAVALALQDTLSNLFAGMQLTLAGNIRVGDMIKLESSEEGVVEDIHWRVTRIQTLPNNFVLIPNNRLAQSVVTNYSRPTPDLSVIVPVSVHYASDLERVEAVTLAVAHAVLRTAPGGVADFEPALRYTGLGESGIHFNVVLRGDAYADSFLLKHEFIRGLLRAYAAEGIVIPYPVRALNLEQEKAQFGRGAS
ncbi:mechanosensitive ion channel family protein [bacterium]|nr:mechanosensitive ion channel family protein [bacterium]